MFGAKRKPGKEPLFRGMVNRILQQLARMAPGATTLRVKLHRARGVKIGEGVWIGYDVILETSRPHLITLRDGCALGARVMVIAHFRETKGVTIEEDAFVGPGVIILPNVVIGRGAVVTAGSVVTRSVKPMTVVQGNPAVPIAECGVPLKTDVSVKQFSTNLRPLSYGRKPVREDIASKRGAMRAGGLGKLSARDQVAPVNHFSVVISCYNQADYIHEAVDSALAQRLPAKEIIVVDDGSTDCSLSVLEHYGERISLIALGKNQGANAARNIGAAKATGEYLVFLDGDDVMLPWTLEVYESVASLRQPKVILSSLRFFSGSVNDERQEDPAQVQYCEYQALIQKDRPYRASASAIVVNRETFFEAGGWTELIFPMEDLDLIVKLGYSGRTVQILSPPTKCYRVHAGNTVGQVRRCIGMLQTVIYRAKRAVYSRGESESSMSRYAFIGGPAWFWVKKGFRAGFYRESLGLFKNSWLMICAASGQRVSQFFRGRTSIQCAGICSRQF